MNTISLAVLSSILAYALGSAPLAFALGRFTKRVDIRKVDTGNVGALNAFQQIGPLPGLLVLLADVGKGVLAVLFPSWIGAPAWTVYPAATLVLVGHIWPVFLGFRGGKGLAPLLGIVLAALPVAGFIAFVPAALVILVTRRIVIGASLGFVVFSAFAIATARGLGTTWLFLFLALLVAGNYMGKNFVQKRSVF